MEHQGLPFFSMEFCAGGSLKDRLAGDPLAAKAAAALVERLAAAMAAAHAKGVIHRDLKPANVLLAEDGTPKVTDFGLARRLEGDSELTLSGQVIGSPNYMPPEQAEAKRGQQATRPVQPLALVAGPALRDFPQSEKKDGQSQRNIDEKHPSPRTVFGEPSTQHGTDGSGDRREAGPRPDGATALFLGKSSADKSQAAGNKEGRAYPLEAPGHNKLPDVGRHSAPGRGHEEKHDADNEDLAAPVQVSQRPANENQGRQEKRVRFHNPLNVRQRRMQG